MGNKKERVKKMREEMYSREFKWTELIYNAFGVFVETMKEMWKVLVAVFLPISILQGVLIGRLQNTLLFIQNVANSASSSDVQIQMRQVMPHFLVQEVLSLAIMLFLVPVGTIAVAKLVKGHVDGVPLSAKDAVSEALALEPTVIVVNLIILVLTFLGSLLIIPGIYLGIAWSLAIYCVGLGGEKGWSALRRSKELVKGRWWRTLGYLLILGIITVLCESVIVVPLEIIREGSVKAILECFLQYFISVFQIIGVTLMYMNREALAGGMPNVEPSAMLDGEAVESADKED